jgi:hypothetical protein
MFNAANELLERRGLGFARGPSNKPALVPHIDPLKPRWLLTTNPAPGGPLTATASTTGPTGPIRAERAQCLAAHFGAVVLANAPWGFGGQRISAPGRRRGRDGCLDREVNEPGHSPRDPLARISAVALTGAGLSGGTMDTSRRDHRLPVAALTSRFARPGVSNS